MPLNPQIPLSGNPVQGVDLGGLQQQALQISGMQQQAQDRVARAKEAADAKKAQGQLMDLLKSALVQDAETGVWDYDEAKILPVLGALPPEVGAMLKERRTAVTAAKAAQKDYLARTAAIIDMTGNDPGLFEIELDLAIKNGQVNEREATAIRDAVKADPSKIAQITAALTGKAPEKPERPFQFSDRLVTPEGKEVYVAPEKVDAPKLGTAEDYIRRRFGDNPTATQVQLGLASYETAKRAPTGQAGNPAKDAATVAAILKNPRLFEGLTPSDKRDLIPALSAAGFEFEKAMIGDAKGGPNVGAIISKIEELSKKINTSAGGMASVAQGVKRGAAASMQMDNDASQYESLVSGMIPMVARAVGHTGVLTQQDVDSVRALFPTLKDNASLAKSKLDTVKGLLAGKTAGGGDPLGIRK